MTELKKKFGKKVKEYRLAAKLSQDALAYKAGITPQTLSGIENGHGFPSYTVLCKIIETLHVAPVCLFVFPNKNNDIDETELTEIFLEDFRELNKKNREFILNCMKYLRKNQ